MLVTFGIKPRTANLLPQETELHIANKRTAFCILTRAFGYLFRSGSFARVQMMQATDFWNLDHMTEPGRLDRSADRRIFFERQMRTAPPVVFEIVLQYPAQPGIMEDDDVVQALPSNGPDRALGVGVLPW